MRLLPKRVKLDWEQILQLDEKALEDIGVSLRLPFRRHFSKYKYLQKTISHLEEKIGPTSPEKSS